VGAFTVGAARDVLKRKGIEVSVGANLTAYVTPDELKPAYGDRPISFQIFLRVRPRPGHMGRMWNMRMSRPM
jgi:hypothetical protein